MSIHLPRAAVLMCHAPIVIPDIGGARARECESTTRAMEEAAQIVADAEPETVVVLSPHAPRYREAFSWKSENRWVGTFSAFGRADLGMVFEADTAAAEALSRAALARRIPLEPSGQDPMDHGALVPLWFVREAGCKAKVLVLGFPWNSSGALMEGCSAALGEAMAELGRRWVLVASGDMSHRLLPGAPSGFHPRASEFDQAVVACVREGRPGDVARIPEDLTDLAAEDVTESLSVAVPLLGDPPVGQRFLSYEGPFGVGYLIAVLRNELS